jgi:hypothetical protein
MQHGDSWWRRYSVIGLSLKSAGLLKKSRMQLPKVETTGGRQTDLVDPLYRKAHRRLSIFNRVPVSQYPAGHPK